MKKALMFIKLLRPQQWIKNLFLFIPIFFKGDFVNIEKLTLVFFGFISFSIVSSAVYILNDYRDIEVDKAHPVKKYRPLASGAINPVFALLAMFVLLILGFVMGYLVNIYFAVLLGVYILMNIFYSLGLKNVSIVDILIVAIGFVLRTISGGLIADVYISHWLIIMIFLLALFLVVAKRRDDILEFMASGKAMRKSIENYNLDFVNLVITMLSGVIIVAYIMYTVSPEVIERLKSDNIYLTSIFVIAGLLRYLQITLVENKSGSPVRILYTDKFIYVTLLGWGLSYFLIIYYF